MLSRDEWGVDAVERRWPFLTPISGEGREVYPAHTDAGRHTTGTSEFTVKVDPENVGVLLRRKLDSSMANQKAEVFISQPGGSEADWKPAGTWYTAGSNAVIFSYPASETGASQQSVEVSNRRFLDDEFPVPRELTQGKSAVRVKVKFTARRNLYGIVMP